MISLVPARAVAANRSVYTAAGSISYDAPSEIRDVVSRIGRTEDIAFSPDDSRLAIADYLAHRIVVFSIDIDRSSSTPRIVILDYSTLTSRSLKNPHGVAFLGNDHLVVCSRGGDVGVFRAPPAGKGWGVREVQPIEAINGKGLLLAQVKAPGSVACHKLSENSYRVLVCSNTWHMVSSHVITTGDSIRIKNQGVLLEHGLRIPDGISVSADHAWIAVSNHVDGTILIYKNTPELDRTTPATGTLRGIVCPHGVRFSPDGTRVFVADAASQYLHVFESALGGWEGNRDPSQSIRLVDDDTFYRGRYDAREGGVKGIDLDSRGSVLATTFKDGVLAFHDVKALLAHPTSVDREEMIELCRVRDRSLARQKTEVLKQRWTVNQRMKEVARRAQSQLVRHKNSARARAKLLALRSRNRWSRETIVDPGGPAVSLTTHAGRLELVFYAIESIGLGSRKPSRIVLWLDEQAYNNRPQTLRRLESRGLEVHRSEDLGPHTKYYPYIDRENELSIPLVTADDDVLYPEDWLAQLIEAHEANPSAIHCHRAHRMGLLSNRLMPYGVWDPCTSVVPSHLNFVTGVSGAIYPPAFLRYLKKQGKGFEHCCPAGDDIWMTVNALRAAIKIAQLKDYPAHFTTIAGSQGRRLSAGNVDAGGNQRQLTQTFSPADLSKLSRCLVSEAR